MKNSTALKQRDVERDALLHRLSRIEGQIGGIRRSIGEGKESDCLKNLVQVKAVHSAVKRFAEAYVETYALRCARDEGVSPKFRNNMRTIIASAFLI